MASHRLINVTGGSGTILSDEFTPSRSSDESGVILASVTGGSGNINIQGKLFDDGTFIDLMDSALTETGVTSNVPVVNIMRVRIDSASGLACEVWFQE